MPIRGDFAASTRRGRGGAGNFEVASQESARAAADLEANQSAADSLSSPIDSVQRQAPSYVGRGGAGNYGSAEDPDNWDTLSRTTSGSLANTRKDSQAQSPTQGRGGAGNYAVGNAAYQLYLSRRMTEDDQKREKLKADIEQDVNEQLAMPQKAKLPAANSE